MNKAVEWIYQNVVATTKLAKKKEFNSTNKPGNNYSPLILGVIKEIKITHKKKKRKKKTFQKEFQLI